MGSRFVIVNPCAKRWQDLRGDGRQRHCDLCGKDVHAVEQYSAEEWERVWQASNGCVCGLLGGESPPVPRSRREIVIGALLTAVAPLMAQSGRVRIVVKDASGAVIPSAEALLAGNEEKPVKANEAGEIVLTDLPIGESRLQVRAPGFQTRPLTVTARSGDEVKVEAILEGALMGDVVPVPKQRRRWWIFH